MHLRSQCCNPVRAPAVAMSCFDNIILATDSYKVRVLLAAARPVSDAWSQAHPRRFQVAEKPEDLITAPSILQVSHYRQYPPLTEYVYSVRPPQSPRVARSLPGRLARSGTGKGSPALRPAALWLRHGTQRAPSRSRVRARAMPGRLYCLELLLTRSCLARARLAFGCCYRCAFSSAVL